MLALVALAGTIGLAAPISSPVSSLNTVEIPGIGPFTWRTDGSAPPRTPMTVKPLDGVFPAAADCRAARTVVASDHGLAIRASGQVAAWGRGDFGQTQVPANLGAVAGVASGQLHSYAILENGTLRAWGQNTWGQLNIPSNLGVVRALETAADTNVALLPTTALRLWGCETCPFNFGTLADQPANLTGVIEIDAEGAAVLARRSNGTLVGWGNRTPGNWPWPPITCGQFNFPQNLGAVTQIAMGTLHALALKPDGTVVAWGATCPESDFGQALVPFGLDNVVQVAAGAQHSLALRADGTVVAWGLNSLGQATPPEGLDDVIAIDAKLNVSLALRADGSIVTWGASEAANPPAGPFRSTSCACTADFNADGAVDVNDFFSYLSAYAGNNPRADLNNNGQITIDDFFAYLSAFAAGCN